MLLLGSGRRLSRAALGETVRRGLLKFLWVNSKVMSCKGYLGSSNFITTCLELIILVV